MHGRGIFGSAAALPMLAAVSIFHYYGAHPAFFQTYAEKLSRQKTAVRVHIAVDSGMHRLGIDAGDLESVKSVFGMKYLKVDGIFTHLGFPRSLSCGNARVRIGEHIAPVIGRICMDQLAVDITDAEDIRIGDTATLIDNKLNTPLSAPDVAEHTGSISNELLCRMGARLPVVTAGSE